MNLIAQCLIIVAMSTSLEAFKLPIAVSSKLVKDLQNIIDLIPMDKFLRLVRAYTIKDREFQTSMYILSMRDVGSLLSNDVQEPQEAAELLNLPEEIILDIYYLVDTINMYVNFVYAQEPTESELQITGGLAGFEKDLAALFPSEKINALIGKEQMACNTLNDYYNTTNGQSDKSNLITHIGNHFSASARTAEKHGLDGRLFEQLLPVLFLIRTFAI
ncbi:uncharacterized protein LOC116425652 [Nomia melanderi]|uniref:uncharacterized protein LOC116425652 n=1 Tax=Nomia melanderi TaxID=2448451 RepID=UPI003FCE4E43